MAVETTTMMMEATMTTTLMSRIEMLCEDDRLFQNNCAKS